jgi:hypothetical protein
MVYCCCRLGRPKMFAEASETSKVVASSSAVQDFMFGSCWCCSCIGDVVRFLWEYLDGQTLASRQSITSSSALSHARSNEWWMVILVGMAVASRM